MNPYKEHTRHHEHVHGLVLAVTVALALAIGSAGHPLGGSGGTGHRAGHRQAGRRRHRRRHRQRDVDQHELLRPARRGVRPRAAPRSTSRPGTRIIGESGSVGTLIVERGGRLNAIGTRGRADRLHQRPAGRQPRAAATGAASSSTAARRSTSTGGEGAGEGDTGVYGGTDPNDNSGILRYVRVEFAGIEFSPDNELNGIAFQGVGRGDAGRLRPGAHEPRRRASSGSAARSTSSTSSCRTPPTTASTGRSAGPAALQFVAVTQRGDDADNGIEADNNEFNNNVLPRSNPQIYNITLCGDPDRNEGGESPRGANLRRGTAFTIRNFLVTGFKTIGFQIETTNTATTGQVDNGTSQMGAGVAWNIPSPMHAQRARAYSASAVASRTFGVNQDPGVSTAACSNHDAPNLQPSGIATLAGGQMAPIQPPNDGFFEAVTLHRRGAAGAGCRLDARLDVVPAELAGRLDSESLVPSAHFVSVCGVGALLRGRRRAAARRPLANGASSAEPRWPVTCSPQWPAEDVARARGDWR